MSSTTLIKRRSKIHDLMMQASKDGQAHKVKQGAYLLNCIDLKLYYLTSPERRNLN